jgi:hypothetical protein
MGKEKPGPKPKLEKKYCPAPSGVAAMKSFILNLL